MSTTLFTVNWYELLNTAPLIPMLNWKVFLPPKMLTRYGNCPPLTNVTWLNTLPTLLLLMVLVPTRKLICQNLLKSMFILLLSMCPIVPSLKDKAQTSLTFCPLVRLYVGKIMLLVTNMLLLKMTEILCLPLIVNIALSLCPSALPLNGWNCPRLLLAPKPPNWDTRVKFLLSWNLSNINHVSISSFMRFIQHVLWPNAESMMPKNHHQDDLRWWIIELVKNIFTLIEAW